ncbi:Nuclear transport factor 2 [Durusdinium trenchii]|uniref:Nuclear transport factor 2 n=1 Tax=Durusdinium trenchii TaxID=1381693 RepID=A0ABP0QKX1_9DINO
MSETALRSLSREAFWPLVAAVGFAFGFILGRSTRHELPFQPEGFPENLPKAKDVVRVRGAKIQPPRREVICDDALRWIEKTKSFPLGSMVFTSLPDMSEVVEMAPRFEDWENFFMKAVRSILMALPEGGVATFYQTDVRLPGVGQVSKAFLVLQAAQVPGIRLKWHKIVHFGTVDQPTWNSVQFTHLLCFGKGAASVQRVGVVGEDDPVVDLGSTIPDVVERGVKPTGLRKGACCMGINATSAVMKWAVRRLPGLHTVIDPFCGAGTVLAVANEYGLDAIGCGPQSPVS